MFQFEIVSPESVGIKRGGIERFLSEAAKAGLELHRLMIVRHGKCCAKITWDPYSETDHHPVFSFSKSITATAIAFARQEGLLSLDEKLVDIFPEDIPENPSENLRACTIHHLLCMSCGHETEMTEYGPDWRRDFFSRPFVYKPGTFYLYNTAGSNMLAAIVKKKTGLQVTEYLRPRLFDPLGMGEIKCSRLPDDLHTEHGGGGMRLTLDDMARFTQFMLQDGWHHGRQLLCDWYYKVAGTKQMETEGDSYGHIKDWAQGYGYQCWLNYQHRSFRADGAFGQFGLVYPELDLCIISNAATEQTQTMMDLINAYVLPAVREDTVKAMVPGSEPIIEKRRLPGLINCRNPYFEAILSESVYEADDRMQMDGIAHLTGGAGVRSYPADRHIEKLRFAFEDALTIYITENGTEYPLYAAIDGSFKISEIDGTRYAATARWRALRRLELEVRSLSAISGVRMILTFDQDKMTIETDETLMTDGGLGMVDRKVCAFTQTARLENVTVDVSGNNPGTKNDK